MRVTVLVRSFERGGAERQGVALAIALRAHGHDASIVAFHGRGPFLADAKRAGVPVTSIDRGNWWRAITFVPRVMLALRRSRPDAVCSYMGGPNVLAAMAKPLLRRAVLVWGVRFTELNLLHEHRRARLVARAEPVLSRMAEGVITNSRTGMRECVRLGFDEHRIAVIPNGIDVDRFTRDIEGGVRWRAGLGVPQAAFVIGRVGRVHPVKGIDVAIRTIAVLRERGVAVHLVSLGDGPSEVVHELISLAHDCGVEERVHLLPATDDLAGPYSALDVLVSPSVSEGFPNVVAEAMACGTPCVVTDVGDSALVVGETGRVVPPRDPGALADAVAVLLGDSADDRERRSKAARHRVESEFSMDALASHTVAFIQSLAGGR